MKYDEPADAALRPGLSDTFDNVTALQSLLVGHDARDGWGSVRERVEYLALLALHTHTEVDEALAHARGWKSWPGAVASVDTPQLLSELEDIILLAMSSYTVAKGDAGELERNLARKSRHNLLRFSEGKGGVL